MCGSCGKRSHIAKADDGKKKSEWKRQHEIADRNSPLIEAGFYDAVDSVRKIVREKGPEVLTNGKVWQSADFSQMDVALNDILAESGESSAYELSKRLVVTGAPIFDRTAASVSKWIAANSGSRAQFLSEQQRLAVAEAVKARRQYGLDAKKTAKMIEGSIGLNAPQMKAMYNLDARLRKQGLNESAISTAVQDYIARAIVSRARLIATTEAIDAANQGQLEFWGQAVAEGLIPTNCLKVWYTTPDDKVCPSCGKMHGQRRSFSAKFDDPMGIYDSVDRPTLHPRCRCSMILEFPPRGKEIWHEGK